jgi:leucyl/phenylalanyl-tRNA--protein transferase
MDLEHPTPELLLRAYTRGIFPMCDEHSGDIGWYSPDPRGVLPLDAFHVPRSLARSVRSGSFEIRSDSAFERVMRECAAPATTREATWIDERLIEAYVGLHRLGFAHSLEAYRDDCLVGGLYGVHIRGAFFGESMFSRPELGGTDASKTCLVHLVARLRQGGFSLLDTQFATPHLVRFGCVEIPRVEYLRRLWAALRVEGSWVEEPGLDGARALALSRSQ